MKIPADENLFWFVKKGTMFDLSDPSSLDTYVQQIMCRGRAKHVQSLFKMVPPAALQASFARIRHFLPQDVSTFWEDCLGSHH